MKRKFLGRAAFPLVAVCVGLAACSKGTTTTTQGPPTAYAVLRLTSTNGLPDTAFAGGRGIVTTEIDPTLFDFALAVAVEPAPSNKIIVAGSSGLAGQGVIALVRYNADGTLDTTGFGTAGTGGIVKTPLPSVASSAQAIAVQPDGKILVAALTFAAVSGTTATTGIALLRYNADGTLDTAFGTGGIVTAAIGPGTTSDTCALALQGTKVIVAGASTNGKVFLYRYDTNANGALDATFGMSGVTTTDLGSPAMSPAIAIQPADNKIVLAGGKGSFDPNVSQPVDQVVIRYTVDGAPDPTFGSGGMVTTDINLLGNFGNAVAIQGDGKIVVAGHANVNFAADASDISLVRYNTDGMLDTTLVGPSNNPNPGIVTANLGGFDNALSVALQADAKIVVSGNTGLGGFTQTVVLRYNPDGTADTSFGVSGVVAVQVAGPSNVASGNAVALQPVGAGVGIVVAGYD